MDLKSPGTLKLKGLHFLDLGLMAAGLLTFHSPGWTTISLLLIVIRAFWRYYDFAFTSYITTQIRIFDTLICPVSSATSSAGDNRNL
jgi:hypothetical protein